MNWKFNKNDEMLFAQLATWNIKVKIFSSVADIYELEKEQKYWMLKIVLN